MRVVFSTLGQTGAVVCLALAVLIGKGAHSSATADAPVPVISVDANASFVDLSAQVTGYDARAFDIAIEILGADPKSPNRRIVLTPPGGQTGNAEQANGYWWIFALAANAPEPQKRTLVVQPSAIAGSGLLWPSGYRTGRTALFSFAGGNGTAVAEESPRHFPIELAVDAPQTFALWFDQPPSGVRLQLWTAEALSRHEARRTFLGLTLALLIGGALIYGIAVHRLRPSPVTRPALLFLTAGLWFILNQEGFVAALLSLGLSGDAALRASALALLALGGLALARAARLIDDDLPFMRQAVYGAAALSASGVIFGVIFPSLGFLFARAGAAAVLLLIAFNSISSMNVGKSAIGRYLPSIALIALAALSGALAVLGGLGPGLAVEQAIEAIFGLGVWAGVLAVPTAASGSDERPAVSGSRERLGLEASGDGVWDWSVTTGEIYVGPQVERRLGLQAGSLCGDHTAWHDLIHPADQRVYDNLLSAYAELPGESLSLVVRLRHADGSYRWFDINAAVRREADGDRIIGVARETTEARLTEERLIRDAMHDGLTGLPNRALFLDRLEQAIHRAEPDLPYYPTLLYIDLDRFKSVNDSLGHAAGDRLLVALARRLEKMTGVEDTVARMGSDEFCFLAPGKPQDGNPIEFGRFVHDALCAPISISGQEIFPSASIGIAVWEDRHERAPDMLIEAELAMREAKSSNTNRVAVYTTAMGHNAGDRLRLESDMQRALERGEIEFLYQPIIAIEDGRVAGFEALMRWNRLGAGVLFPSDFISLAEETGLIAPLGHYALSTASAQLRAWLDTYARPLFVSVNASSRQILGHDLVADVAEILETTRLPRGALKLEVTETMVMANPEVAAQVLSQIKALGAGLALDDFGTGYSALAYLNRFPFDTLKIDQSFIRDLVADKRAAAIVKAIMSVAGDLDLDVVAEGAENEATIERLKAMGCQYAQGFHFGAPMTAAAAEQFLLRALDAETPER